MFNSGVLQVVSAPARFWERGALCFVGRLCVTGLDKAAAFVSGWKDDSGVINLQELYR